MLVLFYGAYTIEVGWPFSSPGIAPSSSNESPVANATPWTGAMPPPIPASVYTVYLCYASSL